VSAIEDLLLLLLLERCYSPNHTPRSRCPGGLRRGDDMEPALNTRGQASDRVAIHPRTQGAAMGAMRGAFAVDGRSLL
jgi:hypothetical protein